jgi:mannosyltransferase
VPSSPRAVVLGLTLVIAAGAVLRLAGLADQSLWIDEVYTATDIDRPLSAILPHLRAAESTPPLYFWMAWAWTHVVGDTDMGIRSLSLLLGVAAIPVAFALAAALADSTAGLAAAALTAVNPFMVWYSQEARAYALFVLLGLLSVLALVHAYRGRSRALTLAWGATCALALATHHFAAALVWPEVLWLLLHRRCRTTVLVAGGLAVVQVALLSLAQDQGSNSTFIGEQEAVRRIAGVPKQFMLGQFADQLDSVLLVGTAALLAAGTAIFVALQPDARRLAMPPIALAGAVVALSGVAAAAGADRVNGRNLILCLALALVAAGVGLVAARRPAGFALLSLLLALFAGVSVAVAVTPRLQRDDWKGVAHALGTEPRPLLVVVKPGQWAPALERYAPGLTALSQASEPRRVAYVHVERPVGRLTAPLAGYAEVRRLRLPSAEIVVLGADSPRSLTAEQVAEPVGGTLAASAFVWPR